LDIVNQEASRYELRLYNYLGQSVFQTGINAITSAYSHSIHIPEHLASGSYLLEIISQSGNRIVQKIVIQ
ncbi:MAG: hypothetical protein JWM14_1641, partial [Chitinophagaceae bacterium]|nr:hypothetical protein [Chitinophagaceae bacterium]